MQVRKQEIILSPAAQQTMQEYRLSLEAILLTINQPDKQASFLPHRVLCFKTIQDARILIRYVREEVFTCVEWVEVLLLTTN